MTAPGSEPESSQVRTDAHAEGHSRQYVAGRDQIVYTGPVPLPVPTMRTLPRDVVAFTGRDAELQHLIAAAAGAAGVVAIRTVDGMPGVGKTALVTRAAHLLAGAFPDGQLFVHLHAHTPGVQPADPREVLAGLLACAGMAPGEMPAGLDARAERWRGYLAGKKVRQGRNLPTNTGQRGYRTNRHGAPGSPRPTWELSSPTLAMASRQKPPYVCCRAENDREFYLREGLNPVISCFLEWSPSSQAIFRFS